MDPTATQQKHCQFELKGMKTEWNEGRLSDSLDPTGVTACLISCEHALFVKTRKEWLWRWFSDWSSELPLSFSGGPLPPFQQARPRLCRAFWGQCCRGRGSHNPWLNEYCRQDHQRVGQKADLWTKEDCSWALRWMVFTLPDFRLPGDQHSPLPSDFSLLEWKCLSYACPTTAFWKHLTCLVSWLRTWRRILFQDESHLQVSPIPDLDGIYMRLDIRL